MIILFTGRKTDLTDSLKAFAEKKLSKLERVLRENPDIHVILTREKHRHLSEIIVKARLGVMTVKSNGADFESSLALAADRLLAQARRLHEKAASARKRSARRSSPRGGGLLAAPAGRRSPGDGGEPEGIVSMSRVVLKPMSVEEAVEEMEMQRSRVLLFRNAASRRVSVVYRRADGRLTVIEPEA